MKRHVRMSAGGFAQLKQAAGESQFDLKVWQCEPSVGVCTDLYRGLKPVLKYVLRIRLNFTKHQAHPEMRVRINNRGRRLEQLRIVENLYLHGCPVWQRIDRVNVATRNTEVADSCLQPRPHIFRKDFGRSNEGDPRFASTLLVHDSSLPGDWVILLDFSSVAFKD